jgi:ATP-dependent Clp protease ATP-binding subunit ClpA
MQDFPVSLDTLITFVRAIQPEGDSLSHLSDAVRVSGRVEEKADALIGYFVDEARRSGASWSEIGQSMGVSKQAVQKRFVSRSDGLSDAEKLAARMPPRARHALRTARRLAALDDNATEVAPRHIVGGLVSEPDSIAALAVVQLGVSHEDVFAAYLLPPRPDDEAVDEAPFGDDAKRLIAHGLDIALHYGHNYVGTEHLLLSAASEGSAADTMLELGLGTDALKPVVEALIERARAAKP